MSSPPAPSRTRTWVWSGLVTVATFYLSVLVVLAAWASVPVLVGWTPMLISSGSMTPSIGVGDVVVVDDHDGQALTPGTVVTFHDSGRLVTHRIVADTGGGYVTKGDANRQPDSTTLASDDIVGTGRILVPFIGRPHLWATSGQHAPLAAFALVTLAAMAAVAAGTRRHPTAPDRPQPGRTAPTASAVQSASPPPVPARPGPMPPMRPGQVWHAHRPLGAAPSTPRGARSPQSGLLARLCVAGLLITGMTVAAPAMATWTGFTQGAGAWAGHLAAPTDLDATAGCSDTSPHVEVSWTPTPNADGYRVYRTTDPDTGWTLVATLPAGDTATWRDANVDANEVYHYHLTATASSWTSDPSATATSDTVPTCA